MDRWQKSQLFWDVTQYRRKLFTQRNSATETIYPMTQRNGNYLPNDSVTENIYPMTQHNGKYLPNDTAKQKKFYPNEQHNGNYLSNRKA
jgi:hypothetical protein